nr:GNAT family N-acetyltransferase [Amycolatopsis sp. NBRC 101858]
MFPPVAGTIASSRPHYSVLPNPPCVRACPDGPRATADSRRRPRAARNPAPRARGHTREFRLARRGRTRQARCRLAAWLRDRAWFAAFDGDDAVALVCGWPGEREWLVFSMWVAPQARGRGLAADLIHAVREAAREAGAEAIGLHVFEGNDRARRVYERLGFVLTGESEVIAGKGRRNRMRLAPTRE